MNDQWREILSKASPFVVVEARERDLDRLRYIENSWGSVTVKIIRGLKSRTNEDFFNEIAASLQFPYYFGGNWDALNDCINDMSWLSANQYILVFSNADRLLSEESPDQLGTLFDILRKAGLRWGLGSNHDIRHHAQGIEGKHEGAKFSFIMQVEDYQHAEEVFRQQVSERGIPLNRLPPLDHIK